MTFGDLYRLARKLYEERAAQSLHLKHSDWQLLREMDELKRIMTGLIQAYKDAGGNKAP